MINIESASLMRGEIFLNRETCIGLKAFRNTFKGVTYFYVGKMKRTKDQRRLLSKQNFNDIPYLIFQAKRMAKRMAKYMAKHMA